MGVLLVMADLLSSFLMGVRLVGVLAPKPIGLLLPFVSAIFGSYLR